MIEKQFRRFKLFGFDLNFLFKVSFVFNGLGTTQFRAMNRNENRYFIHLKTRSEAAIF